MIGGRGSVKMRWLVDIGLQFVYGMNYLVMPVQNGFRLQTF